jgi:23S rRNA pseudouridine1911/1915/1917 synthase
MDILFEDAAIIVVVKPRGVLSEYSEHEPSVITALGDHGMLYPVHRLDRAVGGVMVYAKTKRAAATLSSAVQRGELSKEYTAIVSGVPTPKTGEMRDLLFKDAAKNKSFVVDRSRKGAKEAILRYAVRDTREFGGRTFSRVDVELVTGRSHQIRVQFASRTFPLVGDGKYGSREKCPYLALFACALSFPHPTTGERMRFCAPVPDDHPWNLFGSAAYEIERKFLIAYPDVKQLEAIPGVRISRLEQTYLVAPDGVALRVRRIEDEKGVRYIETAKRRVSDIRAVEEERTLTGEEYEALLLRADKARRPIAKTRYALPYDGHIVEVDVYDFWQDRATAEVELASEDEAFELPAWLSVIREVTADARYKNVNLARELPQD